MPRLRLETQDRDKNHEFGFNEWSENMITMPEHLASISAFGPARSTWPERCTRKENWLGPASSRSRCLRPLLRI